jgi:hypothetical protein
MSLVQEALGIKTAFDIELEKATTGAQCAKISTKLPLGSRTRIRADKKAGELYHEAIRISEDVRVLKKIADENHGFKGEIREEAQTKIEYLNFLSVIKCVDREDLQSLFFSVPKDSLAEKLARFKLCKLAVESFRDAESFDDLWVLHGRAWNSPGFDELICECALEEAQTSEQCLRIVKAETSAVIKERALGLAVNLSVNPQELKRIEGYIRKRDPLHSFVASLVDSFYVEDAKNAQTEDDCRKIQGFLCHRSPLWEELWCRIKGLTDQKASNLKTFDDIVLFLSKEYPSERRGNELIREALGMVCSMRSLKKLMKLVDVESDLYFECIRKSVEFM